MTFTVATLKEHWDSLTAGDCQQAIDYLKARNDDAAKAGDLDSQAILSEWVSKLENRMAGVKAGNVKIAPRIEKPAQVTPETARTAKDALAAVLVVLRQARDNPAVKGDESAAAAIEEAGLAVQEFLTEQAKPAKKPKTE